MTARYNHIKETKHPSIYINSTLYINVHVIHQICGMERKDQKPGLTISTILSPWASSLLFNSSLNRVISTLGDVGVIGALLMGVIVAVVIFRVGSPFLAPPSKESDVNFVNSSLRRFISIRASSIL